VPEKLKDIFFTEKSITRLADSISKVYPPFARDKFVGDVHSAGWYEMALKEKMHHVSLCLHSSLPVDYPAVLEILKPVAPKVKGFEALVFPDYVATYGLSDPHRSLSALEYFTRFGSAEFAVRPFIAADTPMAMDYMYRWAKDEDENVRRLASEGSRPRLPWGLRLQVFIDDPSPVLPILEGLHNDPVEMVRRSVANNLNDISKDHPDIAIRLCKNWYGESREVDRLIKHALRGLLKKGDAQVFRLFGFADPDTIEVLDLQLQDQHIQIGESTNLWFEFHVGGQQESLIRFDYAVNYQKSGGKTSSKVFNAGENSYSPGNHKLKRKLSFADMSTRKHYPGEHKISLIVNGIRKASVSLLLEQA
jgi:3-methyladenine DNA glycosylase AlkC